MTKTEGKKRIGIFGGSFNPIHTAHLMIAEAARDQYALDQLIFVPTGHAPHKTFHGTDDQTVRKELLLCAIQDNPGFALSTYEFEREEVSYTWETLLHFREEYPGAELYFLIGEDSLYDFETWRHPERICEEAHILVALRSSKDTEALSEQISHLENKYHAKIDLLSIPGFAISSTYIREQAAKGHSIRYIVPDAVAEYIASHNLYRDAHAMQFEEMERKLRTSLKKSRYIHTQGVIAAARHLAQIHHYNEEKAAIAALLHDCAKYMPEEERVAYCESHGVDVNDAERTNLTLLHAKCGAVMAEEEFGIENQEILHAIRVHTTGEPEMNLLDKIIFVADYIEPNRTHAPNLEMLRALAETDLDRATALILSDTLDYLKKKGRTIDDTTQEAYDYYKQYL